MKNKITSALTILALGVSALIASAQDDNYAPPGAQQNNDGGQNDHEQRGPSGPGDMMGHRPPPDLLFQALDVNHDGVIDSNEIANASAELLKFDKNGDGKLTQDELCPPRPANADDPDFSNDQPSGLPSQGNNNAAPNDGSQRGSNGPDGMMGHRPPLSPLFLALDVNHDGVIDSNEIANAPAELKTLDKNGDGQLTRDELRPQRPPNAGNTDSGNDRPSGPSPGDQQDNNGASPGPPPGNQ
jgi:hypothetical protein